MRSALLIVNSAVSIVAPQSLVRAIVTALSCCATIEPSIDLPSTEIVKLESSLSGILRNRSKRYRNLPGESEYRSSGSEHRSALPPTRIPPDSLYSRPVRACSLPSTSHASTKRAIGSDVG